MTKINDLKFYFDELDNDNFKMVVEDNDCQLSKTYYGSKTELNSIKRDWEEGKIWF